MRWLLGKLRGFVFSFVSNIWHELVALAIAGTVGYIVLRWQGYL